MFASNNFSSSRRHQNVRPNKFPNRSRQDLNPSPSQTRPTSSRTMKTDEMSELKAKYFDYANWLRAASKKNREPMFTHELLKHSLCQMGIDSNKAGQLVSTCTWYVYQFHKELEKDPDRRSETEKSSISNKRKPRKSRIDKVQRRRDEREMSNESSSDRNFLVQERFFGSSTRPKDSILPPISPKKSGAPNRPRRVDFENEEKNLQSEPFLPKIRSVEVEPSEAGPLTPVDSISFDLESSSSQKNFEKLSSSPNRSILRKQKTSSLHRENLTNFIEKTRSNLRSSSVDDELPLGTKSQRLFGGSECFAQILNELESRDD